MFVKRDARETQKEIEGREGGGRQEAKWKGGGKEEEEEEEDGRAQVGNISLQFRDELWCEVPVFASVIAGVCM